MFTVDTKVRHERYGLGIICKVESAEFSGFPSQKLSIDFGDDIGEKGFYYPPANLRDVASEAPAEDVAAQDVVPEAPAEDVAAQDIVPEAPNENAEQIQSQRMKLDADWDGPSAAQISHRLNAQDKRRIKDMFTHNVANFGVEADIDYIAATIGPKFVWCDRSQIPWVRLLSTEMRVLYRLFAAHQSDEAALPEEAYNLIGATLFWFVDLNDYIPDGTPAYGHLDDSIVLNRCIAALRNLDRDRFIQ